MTSTAIPSKALVVSLYWILARVSSLVLLSHSDSRRTISALWAAIDVMEEAPDDWEPPPRPGVPDRPDLLTVPFARGLFLEISGRG